MYVPLKKREHIKRLPGGGGFGKWTTIMKPMDKDWAASEDSGSTEDFIPRKGDGLRLKNNRFPTTEGVYEIRVVPPGGDEKSDSVVIYLGKAGGEGTNSSLDQRMSQYMYDGSHKADLYNALLKGGCTIQARVMKTGEYSTRGRSAKQRAKEVETKFLTQADYAANKMENGKLRLDSTYINANGKKVSIEQFAIKNGYVSKHSSKDNDVRAGKEARPGGKPSYKKGKPTTTTTSSSSSSNGVKFKKDGTPDMRYKANKEKDLGLKKLYEKPSAADAIVARLKKDGTPDMRFKANKKTVESVLSKKAEKQTPDARSLGKAKITSTSGPFKKDGTPDMRYKANKETSSPLVSSSYTSGSSSSSSSSRISSGPTKRDGTPDMRYKVNRQSRNSYGDGWGFSTGYSGFSGGYGGGFGGGAFSTPMTKSGRPDMRYSINKSLYG